MVTCWLCRPPSGFYYVVSRLPTIISSGTSSYLVPVVVITGSYHPLSLYDIKHLWYFDLFGSR